MKPIPIYDATVPIACTASGDELPLRIDQIERLRGHLDRVDRTDDGVVLHFPRRPEVEAEVRSFTVEEKACCAFWGFAVTTNDHEITLRWDGPPRGRGPLREPGRVPRGRRAAHRTRRAALINPACCARPGWRCRSDRST